MNTGRMLFLVLSIALTSCLNETIYSDYDRQRDFMQYKSFAWIPSGHQPLNDPYNNDIVQTNVKNFASDELIARGLKVDVDSPDVIIEYDIVTEQKSEVITTPVYAYVNHPYNYTGNYPYGYNNYNQGYGYNYNNRYNNRNSYYNNGYNYNSFGSYYVGDKKETVNYTDGTLTISVIDRKTNTLVWKGWGEGQVDDPASFDAQLQKEIHAILKRYPVLLPKKN